MKNIKDGITDAIRALVGKPTYLQCKAVQKKLSNINKEIDLQPDPATLVLLTQYFQQAHGWSFSIQIADIDKLIDMAKLFQKKHGKTNWQDAAKSWEETLASFYNKHKPQTWSAYYEDSGIIEDMAHYLSNDRDELPKILKAIRKALDENPHSPLDDVPGINVWEPIADRYTVSEFCEMVNIEG